MPFLKNNVSLINIDLVPDAAVIPTIALSANAFEEDAQQCLRAGMNERLLKPVDIDQLKQTLIRLLS